MRYVSLFLFLCSSLFSQSQELLSQTQDLAKFKRADDRLFSGELIGSMTCEAFSPANVIPPLENLRDVTSDYYAFWKAKQESNYRIQSFAVQAIFQGDKFFFYYTSEPGELQPVAVDRLLAFDGVSVTMIVNDAQLAFRTPVTDSYRETHFASFQLHPRMFGYDFGQHLKLLLKINDVNGNKPTLQYESKTAEKRLQIKGSYPAGTVLLGDFQADPQYDHVLAHVRYIHPKTLARMAIDCTGMKVYPDGTVFPTNIVVSRYLNGDIRDLSQATPIDRITFTVEQAEFNGSYPDEIFNPATPEGYDDPNNRRPVIQEELLNGTGQ